MTMHFFINVLHYHTQGNRYYQIFGATRTHRQILLTFYWLQGLAWVEIFGFYVKSVVDCTKQAEQLVRLCQLVWWLIYCPWKRLYWIAFIDSADYERKYALWKRIAIFCGLSEKTSALDVSMGYLHEESLVADATRQNLSGLAAARVRAYACYHWYEEEGE